MVAVRGLVEVLEVLQIDNAQAQGWSWRDIARRLGASKQRVHYKHALRFRGRRVQLQGYLDNDELDRRVAQLVG